MLYQLEVLEARHIADLASDARMVRDRLLEKVREIDLGEPVPARGEHNPAAGVGLDAVLETQPAPVGANTFEVNHQAIEALPHDIREKLWAVARIGRGDAAIGNWDETIRSVTMLTEDNVAADLLGDPDLHVHLRKGLYDLGETSLPVDG